MQPGGQQSNGFWTVLGRPAKSAQAKRPFDALQEQMSQMQKKFKAEIEAAVNREVARIRSAGQSEVLKIRAAGQSEVQKVREEVQRVEARRRLQEEMPKALANLEKLMADHLQTVDLKDPRVDDGKDEPQDDALRLSQFTQADGPELATLPWPSKLNGEPIMATRPRFARLPSVIQWNQQIAACKKGLHWLHASQLLHQMPMLALQAMLLLKMAGANNNVTGPLNGYLGCQLARDPPKDSMSCLSLLLSAKLKSGLMPSSR
eukprot:Skav234409  [mRNA]  locus=scaffold873:436479:439615:- [translate_table: standard]